jgi:hypothetical protein
LKTLFRCTAGALAALALAAAPAAAGPTVSVRVEGESQTLLALKTITLDDTAQSSCPATSATEALVTAGATLDSPTFPQTINGETHDFSRNDYWGFSVLRDGRYQALDAGICDELLQEGDELLASFNISDANFDPVLEPLLVTGVPATVKPGETFTITVTEFVCERQYCGSTPQGEQDGYPRPRAGAAVTVNGTTVPTDANGRAQLTLTGRGPVTIQATGSEDIRSRVESTCVTDGADGFCATAKAVCQSTGDDGRCGTRDRRAPEGRILGITSGSVFGARSAPRELRAEVPADPSGLHAVKLRLTRRSDGRCWYFSGRREAFRRTRCGTGSAFVAGKEASLSYLLPSRLPRGRYVLDVVAIDGAFNRDQLARGRNRVVFTVR